MVLPLPEGEGRGEGEGDARPGNGPRQIPAAPESGSGSGVLSLALFFCFTAVCAAAETDFKSAYYALSLSRTNPAISCLAVDCLGRGQLSQNPVCVESGPPNRGRSRSSAPNAWPAASPTLTPNPRPRGNSSSAQKTFLIRSRFIEGQAAAPLVLTFNQRSNHATLLGLMAPREQRVLLPAVLHLPDMGSVRITADAPGWKLDCDARRNVPQPFVRIEFPPPPAPRRVSNTAAR